tara:strand:+ start:58 stop:636 length:579 start_codon:yes stop_codon:yes gene_type:complete
MKEILFIFSLIVFFPVKSQSKSVLNLSCQYDPGLIKKKSKDLGIVENEKLNIPQICKSFSCTDKIEIKEYINETSGEIKYRLRNNWFNHQGIILDNFLKTKDSITITTFVSQAYFLESYFIDRETGNTKRKIYRFDDTVFLSKIKELEKDFSKNKPLYNKNGKLSLKTIESYALEPWETFFFEGRCQLGVGV